MIKFKILILAFMVFIIIATTIIYIFRPKLKDFILVEDNTSTSIPVVSDENKLETLKSEFDQEIEEAFRQCFYVVKESKETCFDLRVMVSSFIDIPVSEIVRAKVVVKNEEILSKDPLAFILSVVTKSSAHNFLIHLYENQTYKVIVDFSKEKELTSLANKELLAVRNGDASLMVGIKDKEYPEYYGGDFTFDHWTSFVRNTGTEKYSFVKSNNTEAKNLLMKNGVKNPVYQGVGISGTLIYKNNDGLTYHIAMDPYTGLPRAVFAVRGSETYNPRYIKSVYPFKEEFDSKNGTLDDLGKYETEDKSTREWPDKSLLVKSKDPGGCGEFEVNPEIQNAWIKEVINTPYGKFSAFGPKKFLSFETYNGIVYHVPYYLGVLDKDFKLCTGFDNMEIMQHTTCMLGNDSLVNQVHTVIQDQISSCQ